MLGLGVRTLWAASAYAVFSQWALPGVCAYTVGSHLLRTHLPRLWGYQPMKAIDSYFYIAQFPDPLFAVAIGQLSKTDTQTFKHDLQTRVLANAKRAKQYPTTILGKNYWADDPHFRLEDHFVTVTSPITTLDQLAAFAAEVVIQPFPAKTPQWCAYLIEDFQDGSALVVRFHHIYQDGVALVNALVHNADKDCARAFYNYEKTSFLQKWMYSPLAMMKVPSALIMTLQGRPDGNPLTGVAHIGQKTMGTSVPFPLKPHLDRAKRQGVTFNDHITAVALRTLSAYIAQEHGKQIHNFTLSLPISMRSHPANGAPLPPGNDMASLLLPMPAVTSPTLSSDINRVIKQATSPLILHTSKTAIKAIALLPLFLSRKLTTMLGDNATLAVTNVPGPKSALTYGGVTVKNLFVCPVAGLPVIAAAITYTDRFTVTWSADKAVVRDASVLARLFEAETKKETTE